jgi:hypothetical protein
VENGQLILKAQKPGESQIFQLIPRSIFSGDFPAHFVRDYIHWLDLSTIELEFRPAGSQWMPGPWQIYVSKPGENTRIVLREAFSGKFSNTTHRYPFEYF